MNLPFTYGIIISTDVLSPGGGAVLAEIHAVELALMLLVFVPLWFINLCVLNSILSFIMGVGAWLFSTLERDLPRRLTALLAVIPTLFELHWAATRLGVGVGYWGAFSW